MQFRFLACALLFAPAVFAQPDSAEATPQMVWQGEVNGTTFLYIHAKRLQVENKGGTPAGKPRYRFNDPLPMSSQEVRLHVGSGRDYVHIVEQPHADNNFTLTVAIEDHQPGSSFYSIALYWDAGDVFDRHGERGTNHLQWSGRVEEEVVVSCAADRCTSEAVRGTAVMHEHVKFARPLPTHNVAVRLEKVDGRGEVRIVEQPSEHNGYTARVRIRDPQTGIGDYAFTLAWKPPGAFDPLPARAERGLLWSGRVAGTVRVTVHGGAAFSEVLKGQPVAAELALFERPLPARSDLKPVLKKQQGRGAVDIVEFPTKGNGYQLIFEIRDSDGGSDMYEVEVSW
jgi:hypothetical protein